MIQITCPSCKKRYRLSDEFAGKRAKCKACGQVLQIKPRSAPAASAATHVPPTPASRPAATPEPAAPPPPAAAPQQQPAPPTSDPLAAPVAATLAEDPFAAAAALQPDVDPTTVAPPAANAPPAAPRSSQPLSGQTSHLSYEISQRPDFSLLTIHLPEGQQVFAEPSAMVSMTPGVHLQAGFKGGIGRTFGRLLGGESLIINTFTAQDGPGEVLFAGGAAGDVAYYRLNNNTLYLQRGAYMLNSQGVEVSGKWQGAKGFFSGEGLVLLKASGNGDIFFNSYGAILPIDVSGGFMVDTGYIVAFEDTLQYHVTVLPGLRAASKVKSFFFGGEGLVCQFTGQGRVWIQTRQVHSFLAWVNPYRPAKRNN